MRAAEGCLPLLSVGNLVCDLSPSLPSRPARGLPLRAPLRLSFCTLVQHQPKSRGAVLRAAPAGCGGARGAPEEVCTRGVAGEERWGARARGWRKKGLYSSYPFSSMVIRFRVMEEKLTNSDPFMTLTDKHSSIRMQSSPYLCPSVLQGYPDPGSSTANRGPCTTAQSGHESVSCRGARSLHPRATNGCGPSSPRPSRQCRPVS